MRIILSGGSLLRVLLSSLVSRFDGGARIPSAFLAPQQRCTKPPSLRYRWAGAVCLKIRRPAGCFSFFFYLSRNNEASFGANLVLLFSRLRLLECHPKRRRHFSTRLETQSLH